MLREDIELVQYCYAQRRKETERNREAMEPDADRAALT
jgi:hypothetical protein